MADGSADRQAAGEVIDDLNKRRSILKRLSNGTSRRGALVDEVADSRSTIYRALDQLAERGLIRESRGEFGTTRLGRTLLGEYEDFQRRVDALLDAAELVEALPDDGLVSTDVLVDAEIIVPDRPAPLSSVGRVYDAIEEADAVTGFSPVIYPETVKLFRERFAESSFSAEIVLDEATISYLRTEWFGEHCAVATGGPLTLYRSDSPLPFGLVVAGPPVDRAFVVAFGDDGDLCAIACNDSAEALQWARDTVGLYRDEGTLVEYSS